MKSQESLPVIPVGLSRVWLSLKAKPLPRPELVDETPWSDDYLEAAPGFKKELTLRDMGYVDHELTSCGFDLDTAVGIGDTVRLLNDEGNEILRRVCEDLVVKSDESDWIISRRARGATQFSTFIDGMMNSRGFLLSLSRLVGVPLLPYPMVRARSQVNYFHSTDRTQGSQDEIGMWHCDGTPFVINILLADSDEFEGGDFLYYDRQAPEFDRSNIDDSHVKTSSLRRVGDAGFIAGTKVYHAVRPVRQGKRISLVMSFHCPYSSYDVNRFWHLASDDGLFATIPVWNDLQRTLKSSPERQFERLGIEPITFRDVKNAVN